MNEVVIYIKDSIKNNHRNYITMLQEAVKEIERLDSLLRKVPEGHGVLCYYCGEKCNSFAGSPSKWPIPLCHTEDLGKIKWHHIGCVTKRLIENQ